MGLSSSKQKTRTTGTIAPSTFAQPFVSDAASVQRPAYDEGMAIQRQFQPGLIAASRFYGDTLAGKYLDQGNPYTEKLLDSTEDDVTDRVNQQFMGRFASGYHTNNLVRELANARNGVLFDQYNRERAYQNDAGRNLAGIATTATALPAIPAATYAEGVGGLLGRYLNTSGTEVTKSKNSLLNSLLSAASTAAVAASDSRLKMDIEWLGAEPDGLGVYRYRYVTDEPGTERIGVMAHEVAELRPWALGPERNGFATVNYGAL